MSRVLTFSRFFPAYHPRAGEETFFVEKILNSFNEQYLTKRAFIPFEEKLWELNKNIPYDTYMEFRDSVINGTTKKFEPKQHTIRAGNRWKEGMKFSPRVWSDKPYQSKQITFAPDIEVKKVWSFEIKNKELLIDGKILGSLTALDLALNDGLLYKDFLAWFKYPQETKQPFQIICWNKSINY